MSRGGYHPNDRGRPSAGQRGGPPPSSAARQPRRNAPGARPVYQDAAHAARIREYDSANTGLLYDRMADIWDERAWKPRESQRDGFLEDISNQAARVRETSGLLRGLHLRRAALWQAAQAVELRVTLSAPLVSGLGMSHALEVGFSWDRNLGVPYLPATGMKGAARGYAERWELAGLAADSAGREALAADIARIFGPRGEPGRSAPESGTVAFHALYPAKPPALRLDVLNPHFGSYYQRGEAPGDWSSPAPVFFLTVKQGEAFVTALQPRPRAATEEPQARADAERAAGWLREALTLTGAGGKTALGYGVFTEARS